jgi:hypothetical protein
MVVLPILTKLTRVSVWAMLFRNKFRTPFRQAVAPSINITLYLVISGSPTALSIRAQWPCLPCNRFQLCSKSNFQMAWSEKLPKFIHQTNLPQYEMVLPRSPTRQTLTHALAQQGMLAIVNSLRTNTRSRRFKMQGGTGWIHAVSLWWHCVSRKKLSNLFLHSISLNNIFSIFPSSEAVLALTR